MFKKFVKNYCLWLLTALITGCQTAASIDTIKLPSAAASKIKTVRITSVEAPPLEVLPDMLETRMPNYAHEYNMVLPVTSQEGVYRSPGGILIAGKVGYGDSVETVDLSKDDQASGQNAQWTPLFELAAAAKAQLDAAQIKTELNSQVARLPIGADERNANLGHWRDAIARWYSQNAPASIGRAEGADAVLEIGIGQYRIFEGQTSLQVLIKLIDAHSGQVLAKTGRKTWLTGDSAQALLYPEGERFKTLVRENGARQMAEAIKDIGLAPMRLSQLSEPETAVRR
jgi:hypothetical protein